MKDLEFASIAKAVHYALESDLLEFSVRIYASVDVWYGLQLSFTRELLKRSILDTPESIEEYMLYLLRRQIGQGKEYEGKLYNTKVLLITEMGR